MTEAGSAFPRFRNLHADWRGLAVVTEFGGDGSRTLAEWRE